LSKPKAKRSEFVDPSAGPVFSVRFVLALLLIVAGIAWITYYYLVVRVDPTAATPQKPGGPAFMGDLADWNYAIGFGAIMLGLLVGAHPSTPMGRSPGAAATMVACFLIGLAWIVVFYLFSNQDPSPVPVMNDLGQKNLFVGIGFMAVGFAYATRWE
jgi:drug/metabolite transporter (DMT)-like permease